MPYRIVVREVVGRKAPKAGPRSGIVPADYEYPFVSNEFEAGKPPKMGLHDKRELAIAETIDEAVRVCVEYFREVGKEEQTYSLFALVREGLNRMGQLELDPSRAPTGGSGVNRSESAKTRAFHTRVLAAIGVAVLTRGKMPASLTTDSRWAAWAQANAETVANLHRVKAL